MGYFLLKILLGPLVRLIWIKKVEGLQNIPKTGPVIVAANHSSYFDFICFMAISPRKITYLAAEKFYKNRFWRPLMKITGQIKVERQEKDKTEVINRANNVLNNDGVLGIFPEGTRSADGEIHKAFTGVARFSLENRVSVVPVGIKGTYEILPRYKKIPKFKKIVEIKIGNPISFNDYYKTKDNEEVLINITREIMIRIADLSEKKYLY